MYRATLPAFALCLAGCSLAPEPSRSLEEAKVVEGPVIIRRGSDYFLRYRRATNPADYTLILPVAYRQVGDAGCFYFYGPVSGFYYGQLVEYPLVYDKGATDLAREGKVFWLNPDGTKIRIPIKHES